MQSVVNDRRVKVIDGLKRWRFKLFRDSWILLKSHVGSEDDTRSQRFASLLCSCQQMTYIMIVIGLEVDVSGLY
jgi:hypothetical protein